ncbi:MAG: guanylate kinase [Gammaproteobacteria bacterium]|jgi:guanylate kinase
MSKNILFILSAPSGAGKTSLLHALMNDAEGIAVSVSHTTRTQRPGEIDGKHYHFVTVEDFQRMIAEDAFIEHAQVFDNFYGTSKAGVQQQLDSGTDVILEIDWQGARQVRRLFPDAVSVFIVPPSVEALRERLSDRGQDSEEVIERRMADALAELSHYDEYDYIIINDQFEQALDDLRCVLRAQHLGREQQRGLVSAIR